MNKGELIDEVKKRTDVSKKDVDEVLNAALEAIVESVSSGDKVTLVGFGTFEARERKAREGRNPKTGAKLEIAATTVPAFSAGKTFREKVSEAMKPAEPPKPEPKKAAEKSAAKKKK